MLKPRFLISAIILIVILVAGFSFFNQNARNSLERAITFFSLPAEISKALFVTEVGDVRILSHLSFRGVQSQDFAGKTIVDVARSGDTTLALMRDPQNEDATSLFRIMNDETQQITADGDPKADVAISPDEKYFAFSVKNPALEGVPEDVYDVRRYTTFVALLSDGTIVETLSGNHPHFLDGKTIILFGQQGVTVKDIEGGEESTLADSIVFNTIQKPSYGADGLFVIQNPVVPNPSLFRITSWYPFSYEFVASVPVEFGYSASLYGTTLYVLSYNQEDQSMQIIKYAVDDLESPKIVYSFSDNNVIPQVIIF